jgi:uncharacterized protein (TIGR02118 family)
MIRVTGFYAYAEGMRFDREYYRTAHLALTEKLMRPFGLLRVEVDLPLPRSDNHPPSMIARSHAYFATEQQARAAVAATIRELAADVRNYTDALPRLEFHEVFEI